MRKKEILKITYGASLIAMAVVLKLIARTMLPYIGFSVQIWVIPLIISGYFLGPIFGLMCGFAADTLFAFIPLTEATPFNLFTISAMLWGLCGALIKILKFKKVIISFILVISITTILETFINSVQLYIWVSYGYVIANLVSRLISMVVHLPFLIIIAKLLVDKLKAINVAFDE